MSETTDRLEILTPPEVAAWLKLKVSTVYAWAQSGRMPCIRISNRVRFVRGDLLRWLEARKEG